MITSFSSPRDVHVELYLTITERACNTVVHVHVECTLFCCYGSRLQPKHATVMCFRVQTIKHLMQCLH